MNTKEKRANFENKINTIIENSFIDFPKFYSNYTSINNEILQIKIDNFILKSFINN